VTLVGVLILNAPFARLLLLLTTAHGRFTVRQPPHDGAATASCHSLNICERAQAKEAAAKIPKSAHTHGEIDRLVERIPRRVRRGLVHTHDAEDKIAPPPSHQPESILRLFVFFRTLSPHFVRLTPQNLTSF
jgi:hypothetical protein